MRKLLKVLKIYWLLRTVPTAIWSKSSFEVEDLIKRHIHYSGAFRPPLLPLRRLTRAPTRRWNPGRTTASARRPQRPQRRPYQPPRYGSPSVPPSPWTSARRPSRTRWTTGGKIHFEVNKTQHLKRKLSKTTKKTSASPVLSAGATTNRLSSSNYLTSLLQN